MTFVQLWRKETLFIAGVAGIGCKAGACLPESERRVGLDDVL